MPIAPDHLTPMPQVGGALTAAMLTGARAAGDMWQANVRAMAEADRRRRVAAIEPAVCTCKCHQPAIVAPADIDKLIHDAILRIDAERQITDAGASQEILYLGRPIPLIGHKV